MFALAVIEREMRVRTRLPVTSWMRVLVGVAASITAITTLNWQSRFSGAQLAGKQMFAIVAGIQDGGDRLQGALGIGQRQRRRSVAGNAGGERRQEALGSL